MRHRGAFQSHLSVCSLSCCPFSEFGGFLPTDSVLQLNLILNSLLLPLDHIMMRVLCNRISVVAFLFATSVS
jgi:hypothetical protein